MSASSAAGVRFVTDGGLETDLIFHHDVDLPDFAAFVLVENAHGIELLRDYYRGYVDIARRHSAGLRLESATWRASSDWGTRLGFSAQDLDRANTTAVDVLRDVATECTDLPAVALIGMIGPRGDGYRSGAWDDDTGADEALAYHRAQVRTLAAAGVDAVAAYTLTDAAEAIGIVRAAREAEVPVEIAFTVETDGRLASGRSLAETIELVDAEASPDGYLLNCAHPDHLSRALDPSVVDRVIGIRPNASRLSHAELDESETLDQGDPVDLATRTAELAARLPALRVIGGCCGTDAVHVAEMWARLDPGAVPQA
ncbi:homocysteine S-methyltransferase family protein [Microbacterium paraoxydans]|uniref:homocysteine S-methyltransferase family protein n=1 Tax=Microbacterium paraoxydans TaxID=199592 RepID=UPI001CFBF418|nr:homocysteine S-methyltransferase family protein [Microbacterium paraoxydans]